MAKETTDKPKKEKKHVEGIPCSEQSLKDYNKTWEDIDKCFAYLDKHLSK